MQNASKDQIPGTAFFGARLSTGPAPSRMLKRAAFAEKRDQRERIPVDNVKANRLDVSIRFANLLGKYFLLVFSGENQLSPNLCFRTLWPLSVLQSRNGS